MQNYKNILTAESVTEGHPDKLCDLIADSVLDACLESDPASVSYTHLLPPLAVTAKRYWTSPPKR